CSSWTSRPGWSSIPPAATRRARSRSCLPMKAPVAWGEEIPTGPGSCTGSTEAPSGRHPRIRTRMAVGGTGSREARTHFTLECSLGRVSLLRYRLDTGRTHQIRVHLQAIGYPVCGDPEYGTAGMLGLERQFLHAT